MADRKLRVTKVRSAIGRDSGQKKTLEALGLGKVNSTRVHSDTLLKVEEVEE
jgi:ribosomal protein L30